MKKLLVLAALSAMVMGAKAEYYTYTLDLPDAQAVYWFAGIAGSLDKDIIAANWQDDMKPLFFNEAYAKELLKGKDWTENYAKADAMLSSQGLKFSESEGSFTFSQIGLKSMGLIVLTDATELSPGAAYAVYYGTTSGEGGPITLDPAPIETGFLMGGSPSPVPEPTSGLLLLVGVAGLALKRKRA